MGQRVDGIERERDVMSLRRRKAQMCYRRHIQKPAQKNGKKRDPIHNQSRETGVK